MTAGGEPGNPEKHAALSCRFIANADEYLQRGDRPQASDKGWGAVAQAVKSIAEERGWNHRSHGLLGDIAYQLFLEWERPDLRQLFRAVESLHVNFYENRMELDEVAELVGDAKTLLRELEALRRQPQKPAHIATEGQRARWQRLTGEDLPIAQN